MLDLASRTVIVTGASSGIGACAAAGFAARGAKVIVAARRLAELEKVASEIRARGGEAHALECDVTSEAANEKLVAEAIARTGRLDVFVANAGATMISPFAETKSDTFRRIMDVNYFGTLYGLRAALPHVLEKRGQLAVVSSFTGKRGVPTRSGYAASKHALHGLCDSLRVELLGTGVGITLYCPGFVDTPIRERALEIHAGAEATRPKGQSPSKAGEDLVRAVVGRRRELVTPLSLRIALMVDAIAPSLFDRVLRWKVPMGDAARPRG
jgi:NAD(P)-dependent dehydrogenase (short-subunit alcohol dehydrogenase family)